MKEMALIVLSFAVAGAAPVDAVNKNRSGLALKGHDPVAYFEQGQPAKGSSALSFEWMGATWRFASPANRNLFQKDPHKYAPQFGGYCAWAVGHGYPADIDPEAWKIVDGKLYLNYSKSVQKMWEPEHRRWIDAGNANWPKLHK
jgi:YHS domain-containing protein